MNYGHKQSLAFSYPSYHIHIGIGGEESVAICLTGNTIESSYLAHVPDESTTATCALDNGTRGLALIILLLTICYRLFLLCVSYTSLQPSDWFEAKEREL